MNKTFKRGSALLLALMMGASWAQGTGSSSSTGSGGSTGSTSSATSSDNVGTRTPATSRTSDNRNTKVDRADRKFIEDAAEDGLFEVQAAQLGATKATDPAIKSFASMLVDDHTAANSELTQIATSLGLQVPPGPPRGKRRDIEKLGKESGTKFDEHFVKEVGIKAHEKDIKRFEKASKDVKDPQLKAWVDKTLPKLREHLAAAQKLPHAERTGLLGRRSKSDTAGGASTERGNAAPTTSNRGS